MLGIDTSKATLQCSLRNPLTQSVLWDLDVSNSESGVATLLNKAPSGVNWVIEPTGRYSVSVVRQARAAGRTVLLAPTRKAKDYLRSLQSRAKTDKLDARGFLRKDNPLRQQAELVLNIGSPQLRTCNQFCAHLTEVQ